MQFLVTRKLFLINPLTCFHLEDSYLFFKIKCYLVCKVLLAFHPCGINYFLISILIKLDTDI